MTYAHDHAGHRLEEGDIVRPSTYPGPAASAPRYRVTQICQDHLTLRLTRADGSHLWGPSTAYHRIPQRKH